MSSRLARVPVPGRRRLAATLLLFATLFIAVAAVAAVGKGSSAAPVFSAIALVMAILLALIAWGVQRSISIDLAEQRLDAAIVETVGGDMCGCGHDHDPDELHVVGDHRVQSTDGCEHDGSGAACAHDCDTCVLAGLRRA